MPTISSQLNAMINATRDSASSFISFFTPNNNGVPSGLANRPVEQTYQRGPTLGEATTSYFERATRLDRNKTITQVGRFKFPSEDIKYYMEIYISQYNRTTLGTVGSLNIVNAITLPLPIQLVDPHEVDYEERPLGTVPGALFNAAGNSVDKVAKAAEHSASAIAQPNVNKVEGMFSGKGAATDVGVGLLDSVAGQLLPSAQAAMRAYSGYSPNQFMVVLLKGPKYKVYEFSWKLAASTPEESENLRQIILLLNKSMSPGISAYGALFSFPMIFQLVFRPNFQQLYKFKPSVLESFTVNYAGGEMPMFFAGTQAPESIEMRMRFKEIEYWLDMDYEDATSTVNTPPMGPTIPTGSGGRSAGGPGT